MSRDFENFNNEKPIYLQIIEIIKINIISEKYKVGQKFPTVRELAIELKVNPNTIQKALVEIEKERLLFSDSTNGRYVTSDLKVINKIKKSIVLNLQITI